MLIPTIHYVTGSDAACFPLLLQVLASFTRFAPKHKLWVCDFGLTKEQRQFLTHKDNLLPIPEHLPKEAPPLFYKGHLFDYLQHQDYDVVTWIDNDCVITGPLTEAIEMRAAAFPLDASFLFTTRDIKNHSIQTFIRQNPKTTIPFLYHLHQEPIPLDLPYLNCGFFFLRSKAFLAQWAHKVADIQPHFLFEQNMFTHLAYKRLVEVRELDRIQWRACDTDLDHLQRVQEDKDREAFFLDHTQILVMHVKNTPFEPTVIPIKGQFLAGIYHNLRNKSLADWLFKILVDFTANDAENSQLLYDCKVLLEKNPLD
ncbi:hypothetical protein ACQZV8_03725 [Magnetococcales bacterium HHB-1]